jgi:hypothetical protein
MGYDFTSGLQITVSSIHGQKHLGICLPTVGSQTWIRSGWEFFRPSGESNQRPWRWIKSARDQLVKCNERRTRPCHMAYYIRGSTPFHSCVEVRSQKLVSSEDRTRARAPSASYCSTEGVAPLHTAPPVPVLVNKIVSKLYCYITGLIGFINLLRKDLVNLQYSCLNKHTGPFWGDSDHIQAPWTAFCRIQLCTKRRVVSWGTFILDGADLRCQKITHNILGDWMMSNPGM